MVRRSPEHRKVLQRFESLGAQASLVRAGVQAGAINVTAHEHLHGVTPENAPTAYLLYTIGDVTADSPVELILPKDIVVSEIYAGGTGDALFTISLVTAGGTFITASIPEGGVATPTNLAEVRMARGDGITIQVADAGTETGPITLVIGYH